MKWEFDISEYDHSASTFRLTTEDGLVDAEYPLNPTIFTAYTDNPELSASQNIRSKNMVVAIGIATVIELKQTGQLASYNEGADLGYGYHIYLAGGQMANPIKTFFTGLAVAALAVVVFVVAPAALVVSVALAVVSAVYVTVGVVQAGIALVSSVVEILEEAAEWSYQSNPPPGPPSITGTEGPAGGTILIDKRDTNNYLSIDLEVTPVQPATSWGTAGGDGDTTYTGTTGEETSGWHLPSPTELDVIRQLAFRTPEIFPSGNIAAPNTKLWTSEQVSGDTRCVVVIWNAAGGLDHSANTTPKLYVLVRKYPYP